MKTRRAPAASDEESVAGLAASTFPFGFTPPLPQLRTTPPAERSTSLWVDMRERWTRGHRIRVEDYIRYADTRTDRDGSQPRNDRRRGLVRLGSDPASRSAKGRRFAAALTTAPDDQWMTVLTGERDAKGVQHTAAIVRAIGKLDGGRKKQARDALADRLTRMTAATLRKMLTDPDPELRRAACLACAMKDDKAHVPDLIDRVTDPSDLVVRAARAGLKSLTGKDYGPDPGAPDEKKVEAASEWRAWYLSQK